MNMQRQLVSAVLAAAILSPIAELTTSSFLPSVVAQAANANQLQMTPQKRFYVRGEEVQLVGRFKANAPVRIIETYQDERTRRNVQQVLLETKANSEGLVSFNYRLPSETFKDNVRITLQGPGRSYNVRIPIGRSVPQPPPNQPQQPAVNFPIIVSSPEVELDQCSKCYMKSDVTLSITPSGGLIYAKTRIWARDKWKGFTGGVEVVLLDQNDNVLYISQLRKYGVNGRYIPGAPDSRTESWNEPIPAEVMGRATKIAIVHRRTPTPRLGDLFKDIKQLAEAIKPVIQLLK